MWVINNLCLKVLHGRHTYEVALLQQLCLLLWLAVGFAAA